MKPNSKKVLVIGAGDGGVCRELLKHSNIEEIKQIEIDEEVVNTCKRYFPDMASSMNDPRVTLIHEDAAEWINNRSNQSRYRSYFDVIIMDTTDFNASDSLFEDLFFTKLKRFMKVESLLVFNGCCLSWYKDTMNTVLHQQKRLFNYTRVYQAHLPMYGDGHYGFVISTDLKDPLDWIIQYKDFNDKHIDTKYYTPDIHSASFQLPRSLKDELYHDDDEKINLGTHLTIDFKCEEGQSAVLDSVEETKVIFDKIVRDFDLHVVGKTHHKFEPQGLTMCYILGESHISIHTWPENRSACLDVFSCRKSLDANRLAGRIIAYFNAESHKINYIDRTI